MTNGTQQNFSNNRHFDVLDSFRGLCALLVAMSHFHAYSIFERSLIFDRGSVYVDFFFVLSGFVIFASYGEKLLNGYDVRKFIWLRFWRLYPLHISVFLAFIFSDLAQMVVHVNGAALYKPFSAPGEGMDAIIANVFLVHSLHILDVLSFNGPSWSISVEFYAYILFALILAISPKRYLSVLTALALISAVLVYSLHGSLFAKLDYGYFRCIYGFVCGILSYKIYQWISPKAGGVKKASFNVLELVFFTLTVLYIMFGVKGLSSMAAPVVFAVFIVLFAFEGGLISKWLKTGPFLLLGALSYSIYMTHMFVSGKFFALPIRLIEGKLDFKMSVMTGEIKCFGTNLWNGTALEIFYLCVVVGCSYITYRLIESPARSWSKRTLKKWEEKKEDNSA